MNINATLIGQTIAMIVFVWFCMKFIWPPIISKLNERQKKIADGLGAADRAKKDLELVQHKVADELRHAREKSAEIVDSANRRANQIVEEAKKKASEEGDRIIKAAQAEIMKEYQHAKEELRKQVAAIVVKGTEKILETSIDETAYQKLLDKLALEL